jgi:hypothetical protein
MKYLCLAYGDEKDCISLGQPRGTDVVRRALEHYRKKPALSFSDCLVLEAARKAGHLPLGTLDRDLGGFPAPRDSRPGSAQGSPASTSRRPPLRESRHR